MTREEVIEVIKAYRDKLTNSVSNQLDGDIEAFEMAIKALEQEPSGDTVSREQEPKICEKCLYAEETDGSYCYECVKGKSKFEPQERSDKE